MFSSRYVHFAVAMVFGSVAVEFFHRQVLSISVEPLKADLMLSDTQVGALLTVFSLAYGVASLVIGRVADSRSRRGAIAAAIGLWSAATLAGGLAAGYAALAATRFATGAGQAANGSATQSLVADYVAPERRATALAIISAGATLGTVVALAIGGVWVERFGWRSTFVWSGAIGLVFAAAFRMLVREPPRGWSEGRSQEDTKKPRLGQILPVLWKLRSFRHVAAAATLASMAVMSAAQWGPAFFQRLHGMSVSEAGLALAVVALTGTVGTVVGGVASDRRGRNDRRAYVRIPAAACWITAPLFAAAFWLENAIAAIAMASVAFLFGLVYSAPTGAIVQALAPLRMRSLAAGILSALLVFIGMGLGPQIVGIASDALRPRFGEDSLRVALVACSLLFAWAGCHFWWAGRSLDREISNASGS